MSDRQENQADAITRHMEAMVLRRMDTVDTLASTALRGLTIINGGAIVAIFALLAQGQSTFVRGVSLPDMIAAACSFAAGLALIMLANWLGYIGQQILNVVEQEQLYARYVHEQGGATPTAEDKRIGRANGFITAAGVSALFSIVAFVLGCGLAVVASMAALPSAG